MRLTLSELYQHSDITSLHVPLTPKTYHFFDGNALAQMKRGVLLVNTGAGALIDSRALIEALKDSHADGAGLDVYEGNLLPGSVESGSSRMCRRWRRESLPNEVRSELVLPMT